LTSVILASARRSNPTNACGRNFVGLRAHGLSALPVEGLADFERARGGDVQTHRKQNASETE
jgi:hypothetical protein